MAAKRLSDQPNATLAEALDGYSGTLIVDREVALGGRDNVIAGENVSLRFTEEGRLTDKRTPAGCLVLNGCELEAGRRPIFYGTRRLRGGTEPYLIDVKPGYDVRLADRKYGIAPRIERVYPEWWGALPDSRKHCIDTTNPLGEVITVDLLQKAIEFSQARSPYNKDGAKDGGFLLELTNGKYIVTRRLMVTNCITIRGMNSRLSILKFQPADGEDVCLHLTGITYPKQLSGPGTRARSQSDEILVGYTSQHSVLADLGFSGTSARGVGLQVGVEGYDELTLQGHKTSPHIAIGYCSFSNLYFYGFDTGIRQERGYPNRYINTHVNMCRHGIHLRGHSVVTLESPMIGGRDSATGKKYSCGLFVDGWSGQITLVGGAIEGCREGIKQVDGGSLTVRGCWLENKNGIDLTIGNSNKPVTEFSIESCFFNSARFDNIELLKVDRIGGLDNARIKVTERAKKRVMALRIGEEERNHHLPEGYVTAASSSEAVKPIHSCGFSVYRPQAGGLIQLDDQGYFYLEDAEPEVTQKYVIDPTRLTKNPHLVLRPIPNLTDVRAINLCISGKFWRSCNCTKMTLVARARFHVAPTEIHRSTEFAYPKDGRIETVGSYCFTRGMPEEWRPSRKNYLVHQVPIDFDVAKANSHGTLTRYTDVDHIRVSLGIRCKERTRGDEEMWLDRVDLYPGEHYVFPDEW